MSTNNNSLIYISDLDGTLLRNDATLSDFSREKLTELLNTGLNFTIASARSIVAVQEVLDDLPLKLPVIEINGAFITDFKSGRHLIINDMSKDVIRRIYNHIISHDLLPFVSTFNGKEDCLYYQDIINDGVRFYYDDRTASKDRRLRHINNIKDTFNDNVVAFTVITTYEKLKPLADVINSEYAGQLETHFFENPYSPQWWWLTIHDIKACKSKAIQTIVKMAGFDMKDLVVFGDNLNDENMFKMAACAIAVENATDDIKQYATEIIGSNEEDSVAKYLIDNS